MSSYQLKAYEHPAFEAVASALKENTWCSGTCQVPSEQLKLYYSSPLSGDENAARRIDFSKPSIASELEKLTHACQPASFGRGQQDVIDESYRKAVKLDTTQFSSTFDLASTGIMNAIKVELMIQSGLRAELYKLNVYGEGSFFKTHKDTPRSEDMIASLVVVFPTPHEGGSLVLHHKGKEFTYDSGKEVGGENSSPKIGYVAFFSDTDHEVQKVVSGHRVTLTYNLYLTHGPSLASLLPPETLLGNYEQRDKEVVDALRALLEEPVVKGKRLLFGLQHEYVFSEGMKVTSQMFRTLKGADASLLRACETLGLRISPRVLYSLENFDLDEFMLCEDFSLVYDADVEGISDLLRGERIGHCHSKEADVTACKECAEEEGIVADVRVVTTPNIQNRVRRDYTAYGNESWLAHTYGHMVLLVEIP